MARDGKLYSGGDVAKRVGCTRETLKYYEKLGKLAPKRMSNGTRVYNERDIATARGLFGGNGSQGRTRRGRA